MKQYQIRFLIFINLLLIPGSGCRVTKPDLLVTTPHEETAPLIFPFAEPGTEAIYKSSFELGIHYYSGLMALRIKPGNSAEVVFINELGMKFFDFIIDSNGLVVKHCFEPLNRRGLSKIFEMTFQMLFLSESSSSFEDAMHDPDNEYSVYPLRKKGLRLYYTSIAKGELAKIEYYKRSSLGLAIQLTYDQNFPQEISIQLPKHNAAFSMIRIEQ